MFSSSPLETILFHVPSTCAFFRYFFELLSKFTPNELERERLQEFCSPEGANDMLDYCIRPKRSIMEALQDFPHATQAIPLEYLFDLIPSMKPRAFSIASSPKVCLLHADSLDICQVYCKRSAYSHTGTSRATAGPCRSRTVSD